MRRDLLRSLGALLLCASCESFSPDVGEPLFARCEDRDSNPDEDVSFDEIHEIVEEYCQNCHTPGGRSPIGIEIGRLDLSSYTTLRSGGAVSGSRIVVPGQPCSSVLLQKIGPAPPFGGRMPLNGPPFVDEDEIQIVHDWIAEGAREISVAAVALLSAVASCGAGGQRQDAFAALQGGHAPFPADIETACRLTANRCTRCHPVERILVARVESPEHWARYVERMRRQPGSGISVDEGETITRCLVHRWQGGRR